MDIFWYTSSDFLGRLEILRSRGAQWTGPGRAAAPSGPRRPSGKRRQLELCMCILYLIVYNLLFLYVICMKS